LKVIDLCREQGISHTTFYQFQHKYAGLDVNEVKRLKELHAELAQFQRIVANLSLQNRSLKDVIEKSFMSDEKRELIILTVGHKTLKRIPVKIK
jgi:putative transposase